MEVRLLTLWAGPAGVRPRGWTGQVPDDVGEELVTSGQAEAIGHTLPEESETTEEAKPKTKATRRGK